VASEKADGKRWEISEKTAGISVAASAGGQLAAGAGRHALGDAWRVAMKMGIAGCGHQRRQRHQKEARIWRDERYV